MVLGLTASRSSIWLILKIGKEGSKKVLNHPSGDLSSGLYSKQHWSIYTVPDCAVSCNQQVFAGAMFCMKGVGPRCILIRTFYHSCIELQYLQYIITPTCEFLRLFTYSITMSSFPKTKQEEPVIHSETPTLESKAIVLQKPLNWKVESGDDDSSDKRECLYVRNIRLSTVEDCELQDLTPHDDCDPDDVSFPNSPPLQPGKVNLQPTATYSFMDPSPPPVSPHFSPVLPEAKGFEKAKAIPSQSFIYAALRSSNQEIRLLVLKASTDRKSDIRCEIVTEALQNKRPRYESLSYTWGSLNDTCGQPIFVHGCEMQVSRNLDLALMALRRSKRTRTLWVDAICINQQNNRERSQQVSLMRKIYSLARRTIVWLGEEDTDSTQAMEWISSLKHYTIITSIIPWEAVIRLFRQSWFTRIWVVQEFLFSKQVEFLVGAKAVQAKRMEQAVRYMFEPGVSVRFMNEDNFGLETKRVLRMFELKASRKLRVISQVLADFRNRGAPIPHDKIYALLGVFKDLTPDAPLPDYDKPFQDVCIEWATYSILNENGLGLLYSCEGPRSSPSGRPGTPTGA
jgi:hypothetical protein